MKKYFFLALTALMCFQLVAAVEMNFTGSSGDESGIFITQLKYEPFPVNPGEYFDFWVKAESSSGTSHNVVFELQPEYPFSLDTNEDPIRNFGQLTSEPVVMHYKVRVAQDAVEGTNELKLKYNTRGTTDSSITKTFDVQVADAQTDFDLVIQESTTSEVSIAIANTGKNTANSLIVRIPKQDGYRISGTNGQMIGNLESGDYSIVSFTVASTARAAEQQPLQVQLDYTDSIGERRSVVKEVEFIGQSPVSLNATGARGTGARSGSYTQATSTSVFSTVWFWALLVVVVIVGFILYRKYSKKGRERKRNRETSDDPQWVRSERTSKKR